MATPLNPATDIPSAIDTLEKLALWTNFALDQLYGTLTYQELPGALMERVADLNIVTAADGSRRCITRSCIRLDPTYVTATSQKLWTFGLGFDETTGTLPASFKVD